MKELKKLAEINISFIFISNNVYLSIYILKYLTYELFILHKLDKLKEEIDD